MLRRGLARILAADAVDVNADLALFWQLAEVHEVRPVVQQQGGLVVGRVIAALHVNPTGGEVVGPRHGASAGVATIESLHRLLDRLHVLAAVVTHQDQHHPKALVEELLQVLQDEPVHGLARELERVAELPVGLHRLVAAEDGRQDDSADLLAQVQGHVVSLDGVQADGVLRPVPLVSAPGDDGKGALLDELVELVGQTFFVLHGSVPPNRSRQAPLGGRSPAWIRPAVTGSASSPSTRLRLSRCARR